MSRAASINHIYTTATSPTATNALTKAGPIIVIIPPISWLHCLNTMYLSRLPSNPPSRANTHTAVVYLLPTPTVTPNNAKGRPRAVSCPGQR